MKECENIEYAPVMGEKEFYCSIDNKCTKCDCVEGSLKFETIPELFEDHLEGDTRVMLHVKHADTKGPGKIIIRGNETVIFIILLANVQKLSQSYLWFDRGLGSDNSRNYVDISKLFKELDYVKALPGIYLYTGIDYLPALYRKGKVRPLLLMTTKQKFVDAFVALGKLDLSENIIADIEEFTCHMYGYPNNKCINDVLKAEFDKKWKPKPGKNPLHCIKSDLTTLLPCSKVLLKQIKRALYVAHLISYPAFDLFPIDHGYKLSENGESLEMHWFDGNQTPDSIEKLENDGDEGNNSNKNDVNVNDSDSEDEESNGKLGDAEI